MDEIVRFYEIFPGDTHTIRAWTGHQIEKKWFHCTAGSFTINVVEINDFQSPSKNLIPQKIELKDSGISILEIPGGFATGIKANTLNSRLQVFSNFGIEESKNDDFRFPVEMWEAKW
ncbi:dTDP-6-deoxy-3,4-keto-hexulose isomerase [Croceivirga thetidis]|uniref:dTDP-6-deoxy-3,4-keto-hexulose isomerase n=1 Tax=Croceivirga thetidis TaxID=2721623 RepID=A0ABX1GQ32_9FLAO|nr:dTDP-6-deoxy-3,4-keto-hexulose isomerase [Croceivirga thetidis]NKI32015.1 dTDP-6-deoxy-3,4-keto-hexulose isomerase [Croceivirga thetidis]